MEDVARQTGISKKTLYANFNNKEHLLQTIVEAFLLDHTKQVEDIRQQATNALEEYYQISLHVLRTFSEIEPRAFAEMKKYHQPIWKILTEYQKSTVAEKIKHNMLRGIQEGIYRDCMNVTLISRLYALSINNIINKEMFPEKEFPFEKIYKDFFVYHASGICNEKGKELLNQIVNRESQYAIR